MLEGSKLSVSLARYNKGGKPFKVTTTSSNEKENPSKIRNPAIRDERKYRDVVLGKKKKMQGNGSENEDELVAGSRPVNNKGAGLNQKQIWGRTRKSAVSKERSESNQVTIPIHENPVMVDRMKLAAIVDLDQPYDVKKLKSLDDVELGADYISSITPFKIAIFFKDEHALNTALEDNSTLKCMFNNARRWTEIEWSMERVTWIEFIGVHPTCCGYETFRKIWNPWGEVIEMDHIVEGINCLTTAKILIRTKHMGKIDTSVIVEWEGGSNEVKIFECHHNRELRPGTVEVDLYGTNDVEQQEVEQRYTMINGEGENNIRDQHVHQITANAVEATGQQQQEKWAQMEEVAHNSEGKEDQLIENGECREIFIEPVVDSDQRNMEIESLGTVDRSIQKIMSHYCVDQSLNSGDKLAFEREWFDPIREVECTVPVTDCVVDNGKSPRAQDSSATTNSIPQKRSRGRLRRVCQSLPEPLWVPATPQTTPNEASNTWNVGKRLGVSTKDDGKVLTALRKSKRLQLLEGNIDQSAGR